MVIARGGGSSWRGALGAGRMVPLSVVERGVLEEPGEGEEALLSTGEGGGGRGTIGVYCGCK